MLLSRELQAGSSLCTKTIAPSPDATCAELELNCPELELKNSLNSKGLGDSMLCSQGNAD